MMALGQLRFRLADAGTREPSGAGVSLSARSRTGNAKRKLNRTVHVSETPHIHIDRRFT